MVRRLGCGPQDADAIAGHGGERGDQDGEPDDDGVRARADDESDL